MWVAGTHLQAELVLEVLQAHPVVQGGDIVPLLLGGRGLHRGQVVTLGLGGQGSRAAPAPPPRCGLTFASCVSSSSTCAMSSRTR